MSIVDLPLPTLSASASSSLFAAYIFVCAATCRPRRLIQRYVGCAQLLPSVLSFLPCTCTLLELPRYLEGKCVEFHVLGSDGGPQRGQCVHWSEDSQRYLVETFDGCSLLADEGQLEEFLPPAPEDGGFDVPNSQSVI